MIRRACLLGLALLLAIPAAAQFNTIWGQTTGGSGSNIHWAAANGDFPVTALSYGPPDGNTATQGIVFGTFSFNSTLDPTMSWGYNQANKSSHPRFFWELEGHYNDGSHIWSETYLTRTDSGGGSYRPFAVGTYDSNRLDSHNCSLLDYPNILDLSIRSAGQN